MALRDAVEGIRKRKFGTHIPNMYSSSGGKSSKIDDAYVEEWQPGCTVREISDFMRITGKKSSGNKSHFHLKRHLPAIASQVEILSSASWRPIDISATLYGLQCLVEDDDGYLAVVASMTAALVKSTQRREAVPSHSISMALLGLQNNKLKTRQSLELLGSITIMIKKCQESLDAQAVGNALYGMQSMSSHLCVGILAVLLRHTMALTEVNRMSRLDLLSVGQAVLLCIPFRRDVLDDTNYELWTKFSDSVCSEHRRRMTKGEYMDDFTSKVEKRMHHAAVEILGQTRVTVSSNEYLFDMFESDIVVRIPFFGKTDEAEASSEGKWLVINIEVDGIHHRQEKKINFCKLRDAYLKSRGVVVHRIDASRMTKMEDNQLKQWLLNVVAESSLLSA